MTAITRDQCMELDRASPFAQSRARFVLPEGCIYMNGNSLGPLSDAARKRMAGAVDSEWGKGLIRSWNTAGWYDLPVRLGDKIARLVGAGEGEVVVTDSTSVNLFKVAAAAAALRPGRTKIISEKGNFPTDLYVLDGVSRFMGGGRRLVTYDRAEVIDAIDEDTAVVVLTHVHYVTAEMFDMAAVTKRAHDVGALIVWDLSHSVGAVEVQLNAANADFAVGCGYKYLNGGPGAPAFVFVANRHLADVRQPLSGWFGHAQPFAFVDDYTPAANIRRMMTGTPPVLSASALEAAVDLFAGVDMKALRAQSVRMSELFITLCEQRCAGFGLQLASPRDAVLRGSHVSLAHPDGYAIMQALIARGVIGDFRAPHFIRFGFTPLYLTCAEVWDAVETLQDIMATKAYAQPEFTKRHAVT
jgi:kynureninase